MNTLGHTARISGVPWLCVWALLVIVNLGALDSAVWAESANHTPTPELVPQLLNYPPYLAYEATTPYGQKCAISVDEENATWWDEKTHEIVRTVPLASHALSEAMVTTVVQSTVSPNGRLLATTGSDYVLRLQDAWTGHLRYEVPNVIGDIIFSTDSSLLAARRWNVDAKASTAVLLYNSQEDVLLQELPIPDGNDFYYRFSPDGKSLASCVSLDAAHTDACDMRVWDIADGKLIHQWLTGTGRPLAIHWIDRGKALIALTESSILGMEARRLHVSVWDAKSGEPRLNSEETYDNGTGNESFCFTTNDKLVVSGVVRPTLPLNTGPQWGPADTIEVWDFNTAGHTRILKNSLEYIKFLDCSPDGGYLAAQGWSIAGKGEQTQFWNLSNGVPTGVLNLSRDGPSNFVQFDPNWKYASMIDGRGTEMRWPIQNGIPLAPAVVREITVAPATVTTLIGLHDGSLKVAGPSRLWDLTTGNLIRGFSGQSHRVSAVAIAPNDLLVASAGGDGGGYSSGARLCVWETTSGRLLWNINVQLDRSNGPAFAEQGALWTTSLAFSPDASKLIVSSGFGQAPLTLYDSRTGKQLWSQSAGTQFTSRSTLFSPDGTVLACGQRNWNDLSGQLDVRAVTDGRVLRSFKTSRAVESLAFSPNGTLIAAGTAVSRWKDSGGWHSEVPQGGLIELFDTTGSMAPRILRAGGDSMVSLAFSSDGSLLAGGSRDNTVRVWDVKSGVLLHTMNGHAGSISAVAFRADGHVIVSLGEDDAIKFWDARNGDLLATLYWLPANGKDWLAYAPNGKFDCTPGAMRYIRWRLGDRLYPAAKFASSMKSPGFIRALLTTNHP